LKFVFLFIIFKYFKYSIAYEVYLYFISKIKITVKTSGNNFDNVCKNILFNIYMYFSIWVINLLHENIIIQIAITNQLIILKQELILWVTTVQ
jgi:hypothetical protein